MRGIADQNHAAAIPFIECDPVDRSAMDLLVPLERCEILLYDLAEIREPVAQTVKPAGHRLVSAGLFNVAKAVGASVAYRAEPKEAAVAQ
jgi:hypothetical protein